MHRLVFVLLFFGSLCSYAQDIIFTRTGDELTVRVKGSNGSQLFYQKHNDADSNMYVLEKSKIFMVKFADGRKELFESKPDSSAQVAATARVYLYWPKNMFNSALRFDVYCRDTFVVNARNGLFNEFEMKPTEVLYHGKLNELRTELKLELKAGETYYIKCYVKPKGMWGGVPIIELMDNAAGSKDIATIKNTKKVFGK